MTDLVADTQPHTARTIAFLGAKGGAGTSTVAMNVASVAASSSSVCLADFDFSRGDLANMLDLHPPGNIAQLMNLSGHIDDNAIQGAVLRHLGGFDAICQPRALEMLAAPDGERVQHMIARLRDTWDRVLLDLGSRVDVASLTSVVEADRVVIVAGNRVGDLHNVQRILRLLDVLDQPEDKVRLVICPFRDREVSLAEVETHLSLPVAAIVREDHPTCRETELHGRLATDLLPDSRLAHDVKRVWDAIEGDPVPLVVPARGPWPWSR